MPPKDLITRIKAWLGQFSEFPQWRNLYLASIPIKISINATGGHTFEIPGRGDYYTRSLEEAERIIKAYRIEVLDRVGDDYIIREIVV
jgi:hypothetical protein